MERFTNITVLLLLALCLLALPDTAMTNEPMSERSYQHHDGKKHPGIPPCHISRNTK